MFVNRNSSDHGQVYLVDAVGERQSILLTNSVYVSKYPTIQITRKLGNFIVFSTYLFPANV